MFKIGVVGYGTRVSHMVDEFQKTGDCILSAIVDPKKEEIASKLKDDGIDGVSFYDSINDMVKLGKIDAIAIGTRCSLHAELGAEAIKYGLPLFLEKPVAIDEEGLTLLEKAIEENPEMKDKIVVSFPLRLTNLVRCVKEIIDSGKLGKIEHVQAYNNVPYGRGYFHKWYRDESETGGLWLQKATHDFDYINYILGIKPVKICAMKSKQIFKGDMPLGLKCEDCDKQFECPESKRNVESYGDPYSIGEWCCFATDTGNEDSGSAIILYESGMHVVYSQNFFVRKGAGKRGARLMGYKGTVEFDWTKDTATVYMHNEDKTETYKYGAKKGHGGGDEALAKSFVKVLRGEKSDARIEDGILSARMCLAAKKSSESYTFVDIK